jgi:hypothetical protein
MYKCRLNQLILLGGVFIILLSITACEKDGAIKIYNHTSFPVYTGIASDDYVIPGGASKSIPVTTARSSIFNPDVEKKVLVDLIGETYMIYDDYLEHYVRQTNVYVTAGKTTNVYINPNLASVKVRNLSDSLITQVIVERHQSQNTYYDTYNVNIPLEGEWHAPTLAATANNQFYLRVRVVFSGGTQFQYGGSTIIKEKDEQFLITVLPPTPKG